MLAPHSAGRAGSARSLAVWRAASRDTPIGNVCRHSACRTRVHLHVVRAEGDYAVTVDTTAEPINLRPLHPTVDRDVIPTPATTWLPAVSTSRKARDDPQGWYQQTLAAE